ncbi:MAG: VOC family protein [Myxococcales bacterium]|nr:VOC family protein [Myxococcales bacterium]
MTADAPPTLGLRHLALFIPDALFDATVRFYREGMAMDVDWQPDPDNVYLSSGPDNLAIHRALDGKVVDQGTSPLDHLGFCVPSAAAVEAWHARIAGGAATWGLPAVGATKRHRDDSTSFYFRDPAGHQVQIIHIPSLRG